MVGIFGIVILGMVVLAVGTYKLAFGGRKTRIFNF